MKIVEIKIYGYGKFEDISFPALHSTQVFFGENEAGKSTIMSFIHSILFGFPTRFHSELRYEPKKGAKYGGSLTVIFPDKGKVTIERVKGKAAGDVSVRMENGRIGGEELLQELLSSVDKSLFQAIYSFNLHGLQNVHQMKGEELSRFLFSTGVIGSDRLVKAENDLNKELDLRFKPNGRNPILNTKLKELRQVWKDLKKAEEKNEEYTSYIRQSEAVEQEIAAKRQAVIGLSQQLTRFEEWKKAEPLLRQEQILKEELAHTGHHVFPENGLQQMEQILERQSLIERNQAVLTKRIETLQAELEEIEPDFTLISMEQEVSHASESLKLLEQRQQENLELRVKLKKLEDDIVLLRNKLHYDFTENDILNADTSIFMREKAAQLMTNQQRLTEKQHELDEQFQREKNRLEELEKRAETLKSEILPEIERQRLIEQLADEGTKELMLERFQEVKERLLFLTNTLQQEKKYKNSETKQYVIYLLICLFLIAAGWSTEIYIILAAGGLGLLFVLFLLLKKRSSSKEHQIQEEIRKWQRKEEEYRQKLDRPKQQIDGLEQRLKRDDMLREQLLSLNIKMEEQQLQYDRVIDQFEQWEKETVNLKRQLLSAGKELFLPERIALYSLFDAFQIVDDAKRIVQEKRHLLEQLSANEQMINKLMEPLQKLSVHFFQENDITVQEAVLSLKRRLRLELDKGIKYEEKREQLNRLHEEWKEQSMELERLIQEKEALLVSAACENEEQFRNIAHKAAKEQELQQQLERISLQLKMIALEEYEKEELYSESQLEAMIQETREKIEMNRQSENKLQDQLAQLKYNIHLLEDGGTYAELLHRFKLLQSEFAREAREWAVFITAKEMLHKTVQTFKEERMPKMLQTAQKYLSYLTEGEYIRIISKREGTGFLIENNEGVLFEANELSQATTEQIYVSIRLALAVTIYNKLKFPIIIDDSFVNFDAKRTGKMMHLLKQLNGHQILFFTCHEHLLKYFNNEDVINLSTLQPAVAKK